MRLLCAWSQRKTNKRGAVCVAGKVRRVVQETYITAGASSRARSRSIASTRPSDCGRNDSRRFVEGLHAFVPLVVDEFSDQTKRYEPHRLVSRLREVVSSSREIQISPGGHSTAKADQTENTTTL